MQDIIIIIYEAYARRQLGKTAIRKSRLIKFSVTYLCKSEIKSIFKSRTEDIGSSLFVAYARYYLLKFSVGERKGKTRLNFEYFMLTYVVKK
uniref:Uncharacterized protein n=1 Tax=Trichogramma kaykai TaxID=54128 RepID=A0ABD2WJ09_9HYME